MSNQPIGMVTEQGDLGLGFDPLNEQDQQMLKDQEEKSKERDAK